MPAHSAVAVALGRRAVGAARHRRQPARAAGCWCFVFKPATTLLIIAWAWPRGGDVPAMRRWVRAGLVLSLAGDVFLMWPEGFLPGLVSFLLAHLAYIAGLHAQRAVRGAPDRVRRLRPDRRRAAVATLARRAAGTARARCSPTWSAWRPWRRRPACSGSPRAAARPRPLARSAALGGLLFMTSDTLLAFNKFGAPVPLAALWILATYWLAQGLIARSLRARAGQ